MLCSALVSDASWEDGCLGFTKRVTWVTSCILVAFLEIRGAGKMMSVFECVRGRIETREFKPDPVPKGVLQKILEAGRWSPSQRNRQPWHFVVIQERETLRQLAAMAPSGPYLAEAPLAIVVVTDGARQPLVDATRAISSMQLVAWEEGLGSCWVGGIEREGVKGLLGIPEACELITVLPFGYPTDAAKGLRKRRKPLQQIAHLERFGTPYRPV
jgi:nitroreductase